METTILVSVIVLAITIIALYVIVFMDNTTTTQQIVYVDQDNGHDDNVGGSPSTAVKTLLGAFHRVHDGAFNKNWSGMAYVNIVGTKYTVLSTDNVDLDLTRTRVTDIHVMANTQWVDNNIIDTVYAVVETKGVLNTITLASYNDANSENCHFATFLTEDNVNTVLSPIGAIGAGGSDTKQQIDVLSANGKVATGNSAKIQIHTLNCTLDVSAYPIMVGKTTGFNLVFSHLLFSGGIGVTTTYGSDVSFYACHQTANSTDTFIHNQTYSLGYINTCGSHKISQSRLYSGTMENSMFPLHIIINVTRVYGSMVYGVMSGGTHNGDGNGGKFVKMTTAGGMGINFNSSGHYHMEDCWLESVNIEAIIVRGASCEIVNVTIVSVSEYVFSVMFGGYLRVSNINMDSSFGFGRKLIYLTNNSVANIENYPVDKFVGQSLVGVNYVDTTTSGTHYFMDTTQGNDASSLYINNP